MNATLRNHLHTAALLAALGGLMTALGGIFAGPAGALAALGLTALLWAASPKLSVGWLLKSQGARPLAPWEAPELHRVAATLAARAGLARPPRLFLSRGLEPQAFTVGEDEGATVVLSAGLLRSLDPRELTGVLAHEISHVKHRDTRTMRLAGTFNAVTVGLSRAGMLVLLVGLPLMLLGQLKISLLGVALLLAAPLLGQALQLALSRAREHAADDAAVALTGDPEGLASALVRLERHQRGLLSVLFGLGAPRVPEWLRTHPATEDRVRRLLARLPPERRRPYLRPRPAATVLRWS